MSVASAATATSAQATPSTATPSTATPSTATPSTETDASTVADAPSPSAAPLQPTIYDYTVVNTYPHDPNAFTQGLVYLDGIFYEGTGLYGRSSLRKVALDTGQVLQQHDLDETFFGEGIAVLGDEIYQLTWQNGVGFVYDRESFTEKRRFTYATEGWGLTHDGENLIMSDGTPIIYFRDPATLEEVRRITVTVSGEPVMRLNELEYIDGKILANVWQTDYMLRIDPATGVVDGVYDFTGLLAQAPPSTSTTAPDVLNGVAYDRENDRFFVTGKLWPALFEVELHPRQTQ
ncbi:MAG TPA: glutamine cyclotransferase [Chloroflexi bacterium]|nr:glutamine cyclotransferase [Chloroflexota bacterium]